MDGFEEMKRSHHLTPNAVEPMVAIDRERLLALLEADDEELPLGNRVSPRGGTRGVPLGSRVSPSGETRERRRALYLGAMAVAAAAVVGGFFIVGRGDSPIDPAQLEVADLADPTTSATSGVEPAPSSTSTSAASTSAATSSTVGRVEEPPVATAPIGPSPESTAPVTAGTDPVAEAQTGTTIPSADDTATSTPTITGPFNQSVDLLTVHYDFAHLDDGHAAVAMREIATSLGLEPYVVGGTGDDLHDYEPLMRAAWGDDWLDARVNRVDVVNRSAQRWLVTLDAGGRVWVAEGGTSDFTAEVVREIQTQRPELDTGAAIHVVQHNSRNELASDPESLDFVKTQTAYDRIADGNGANETADLNQPSATFEAKALAGPHRDSWSTVFAALSADKLDFSDTVEVLHILGVGLDDVAGPDDFANRFMR